MSELQHYSTQDQPQQRKIKFWSEITGSALTSQVVEPLDRQAFCGRMTRLDLGPLRVVELNASASMVTCQGACSGGSEAAYLLRIMLDGSVTTFQHGREAQLGAGDFTLCDTARPYRLAYPEASSTLIVRIPRERLPQYVGDPEAVLSLRMPGDSGLSRLASRHIRDVWQASQDFVAQGASQQMMEITLNLLSSAYAAIAQPNEPSRSGHGSRIRVQVVRLIEQQLTDPQLTPAMIARQLQISPGYLHRVFSQDSETLARYILHRRVDACACALRNPLQSQRSITAIAFGSGFNSLPHFCRTFRERYGMSPREYRHAQH